VTGSDCPEGSDCLDAVCTFRCSQLSDCQSGESCRLGYCQPAISCSTNCDCPTSERCLDGICQP
jgi:hypothetical protein